METKPPIPPFTLETATLKVRAAEDVWNTRDPERVALAYRAHLISYNIIKSGKKSCQR